MLFPVKKLPSINSTEQYLVSASPTTEDTANSSCPLLLKYHNIEDTNYLLEQFASGVVHEAKLKNKFLLSVPETNRFSSLPDLKAFRNAAEMSKDDDISQAGLVGLYNLENACFLNSIIQCLRFTEPLYFFIVNDDYLDDLSGNNLEVVEEFSQLVKSLWSHSLAPGSAVSPRPFMKAMRHVAKEFDGRSQQDAHEFLLCLLTVLHENLNTASIRQNTKLNPTDGLQGHAMWQNYLSNNNSRIIKLFVGQLRSTLICTSCNKMSSTFDPFWDLSLPIPNDVSDFISIKECLSKCLNDERIDGANMPFCEKCKKYKPSQKRLSIFKLPKILVLHLKRFSEDQEKLNSMVDFPVTDLDLGPFCTGNIRSGVAKYDLYAVVNHTGSVSSGHYTAFCHHPQLNQWFKFNDHHISQVDSAQSVVTNRAYILFYRLWSKSSKL